MSGAGAAGDVAGEEPGLAAVGDGRGELAAVVLGVEPEGPTAAAAGGAPADRRLH